MFHDLSNLVLTTQAKMLSAQYFDSIVSKNIITLVFLVVYALFNSTASSPT